MQLKQADILFDLDKRFIASLMDVGVKSSYSSGTRLFSQGDPAERFFILLKGRVKLTIGDDGQTSYIVNHGGEAFGWSALTGRYIYSGSAICTTPSSMIVFDRNDVERLLEDHPRNAALFYRNLALTLGNRLTLVSSHLGDHLADEDIVTYGTGQVQDIPEMA